MKLPAHNLKAFLTVAKIRNFSRAAELLALTQSALSQRILNLEDELETTLFIREKKKIQLTPEGLRLFQYVQTAEQLESEFLEDLGADTGELQGTVRIAGFSSTLRSVILPAITPLLHKNPKLRLEVISREVQELPKHFLSGEADFMILIYPWQKESVEAVHLGEEELVCIRSKHHPESEFFLDHHEDDETTFQFLRMLGQRNPKIKRRYLDDVYGLIDGVRNGLGNAVVPKHLIAGEKKFVDMYPGKVLKIPVVLHYWQRSYQPRLHKAVVDTLIREAPEYL